MAIEKRQTRPGNHGEDTGRTDFEAAFEHIRENPMLYVAGVVFAIVVVVAGILYYSAAEAQRKQTATAYLEALLIEEPERRASELARVATEHRGELAAEALYMAGESAYRTGDHDRARTYFERLRSEYGSSPFVAPATEGLGYILEDQGDPAAAMTRYREVLDGHPRSFEARRQWFNLARAAEKTDDIESAVSYYTEQTIAFPGSVIAQQAQAALDRLRREHPGLFPEQFDEPATGETSITFGEPVTAPPAGLLLEEAAGALDPQAPEADGADEETDAEAPEAEDVAEEEAPVEESAGGEGAAAEE